MVEVTIGGDQSVDHNGGTEGKCSTHLNTDQSSGFEHPSRSGFVEGGERNNTHCVIFLLCVFLFCVKLRLYCKLSMNLINALLSNNKGYVFIQFSYPYQIGLLWLMCIKYKLF